MIGLRLAHILAGAFWAGSLFFSAGFLVPAVGASGPAGGAVMQQVMGVRRFPAFVGTAALLTILSGAGMYWRLSSMSAGAFARTGMGMTLGVGAVAGLITLGIAVAIVSPAGAKMMKLGSAVQAGGGPPTAAQASEMAALQNRAAFGTRLGAAFMLITVAAMAIARYV
jgi:hypothetical protein